MEEKIIAVIEQSGPRTGAELRDVLGDDGFAQWKACMCSGRLLVRRVGRRYLRLDRRVDGYARLSPSILREFLTYSVVGLAADQPALEAGTQALSARVSEISAAKLRLAQRLIGDIGAQLAADGGVAAEAGEAMAAAGQAIVSAERAMAEARTGVERPEPAVGAEEDRFCVLLAGDIVYGMAHDAPRPEKSTGRMVRGSDIDLVVIMDDEAPEELRQRLDDAIYQQKYRYLINPSLREEIDYTIKPLSRLAEQASFEGFKNMVPCKIMDEAVLLYGSERLYRAAKSLLDDNGVPAKLALMEEEARRHREKAERHLLERREECLSGDDLYLFYTSEEREEFE